MPLTQLSIEVPGLGDNSKNLEVEGAIAVGEKVAVSVSGLPADVSTSGSELRLRVLGPIGEDVATHGEWTYDAAKKTYATTLDLASVQAFRLFFPPPPPPRPHIYPRPPAPPMPLPPPGYDPVATAAAMQPPNAVNVRLVLELRDKSGSDSDSDGELVDASLIGTSSIRLNYWPADWQTATLIDLANGRVYSKEEVDALIAEEARQRGVADATETVARIAGDAETLASSKAYADEKAQELDSRKADLVDGKVPASQLPSYVDDVVEYDSRSAFPATGEKGKIYVALDTNKIYRWSGSEYVQVGGGDAPVLSVNGKTGAVVLSASDVGAVNRSGDTMSGGLTVRDLTVGLGRATGSTVGESSVAEGEGPTASGYNSHAEGTYTTASGEGAHAEGCETVAQNSYEHAQGQFNASHTGYTAEEKTIHSIGVGTSVNARKNAVEVMLDGKVFVKGVGGYDGTNPTTADGLAVVINDKQDTISDLATIRSGAAAGATAVQPAALSAYRTASVQDAIDGAQDEAIAAKYTKPATGIPASDLAEGVIPSVPSASDATPQMDGVGAAGTATTYARGDHQHPTCIEASSAGPDGVLTVSAPVRASESVAFIGQIPTVLGMNEAFASGAKFGPVEELLGYGPVAVRAEWSIRNGSEPTLSFRAYIPLAGNLAAAFSLSSTYAVGDYCTYEGRLYKCTTAVTTAGAWNAANWSAVAVTDEMGGGGAPKNVWYVGSTTGTGGTISGSTTTGDFVLAAGNVVVVKMSYGVNATSATLNIDGTGAKQISTRSGTTTFPQYFWSNGQAIAFVYSGTYYIPCGMATATIYNSWGLTSLSSTVSDDETKAATPKAVNTRAPKESPAFTGTPTAPTASAGTNTTQIATTAFVQAATGGKLDATERNLLAYASTTTIAPQTAVYRAALNADGTFPTVDATAIPTAAAYYCFELELTVPSTVPSAITGPSGWTWLDGHGLPDPADLSGGETICVSVRLDCTARTFLASVWRVA